MEINKNKVTRFIAQSSEQADWLLARLFDQGFRWNNVLDTATHFEAPVTYYITVPNHAQQGSRKQHRVFRAAFQMLDEEYIDVADLMLQEKLDSFLDN
jgi:hypothetical protein